MRDEREESGGREERGRREGAQIRAWVGVGFDGHFHQYTSDDVGVCVRARACVSLCVCVCVRERERERDRAN
jgi:hypothetical protein